MLVPPSTGVKVEVWVWNRATYVTDDQQGQIKRSRDEILRALEHFPTEYKRVILDPSSPEALVRPAFDGGWGIVEILPHLKDWEEIYLDRVRSILTEDNPALPGFDDTLWSIERDYRAQDPLENYAAFTDLRGQLVALLRGAAPEDWEREGIHGYHGNISLLWLADRICDHDEEHFQQSRDALTV